MPRGGALYRAVVPALLPLMLFASAPQDAAPAPRPRVTSVAVARARILSPTRISFVDRAPVTQPQRARRLVRLDGRVEIQFE